MNIQLSISLLASDRADTLANCLSSLTPFLKELDSELIVVFTGKEQQTLELIQQYTSHIIPFAWCDDFSKARNAGLREAKGEWFLYIDDDEWFQDPQEIITFFKSGEYRQYQSAFYVVRNYTDWSGRKYTDAAVGRMCRLLPETQFIYPVHENLSPFLDPSKVFGCYVHHYGYAEKESVSGTAPRFNRNLPILLKSYGEEPTAQNCMQLVQEYQSVDDYETAVRYCRQGLILAQKEKRVHACELWMQVRLPLLLSLTGKKEDALEEGERLLASPRTLEVGEAHLHGILSGLCWELKEYRKGMGHVTGYRERMGYLKRHPEKALQQNAAAITCESAAGRAVKTYIAGLLFASELEEPERIKEILTWVPWEDEPEITPQYENLEKWKYSYPSLKDTILEGYSGLKTANPYVTLQKLIYTEIQGNLDADRLYRACAETCPAGLLYQLAEFAVRNGYPLKPVLDQISIETWDECTRVLAAHIKTPEMEDFLEQAGRLMPDYPVCIRRLEQRFLEKQLMQEKLEACQVYNLLSRYCECTLEEAGVLYKDEVAGNPGHYALPCQIRFAGVMKAALEAFGREDYMSCIPQLKKAVRLYPQMAGAISCLTDHIEKKTAEPEPQASEEFEMLGRQIKQMLPGLMESGQWAEAYAVVNQLITLLPGDLDILRLKQEITEHMSQAD